MFDRVNIEPVGVPAIDMSAITQLADNDDMGDQFVAEIIEVFLATWLNVSAQSDCR